MRGKRVFLYVTDQTVVDVGSQLGQNPSAFIPAILSGPPWATRSGICQRALQALTDWRRRPLPFPPYIGFLAVFVLAAGLEGDFPTYAYYPRLRQLTDLGGEGTVPSFDRMSLLWDDLERWSRDDLHGEKGLFKASIAGAQFHIGFPLSQTILTERERSALPMIFSQAGFDPVAPPNDIQMLAALSRYGQAYLSNRTIEIVRTGPESERRELLLDIVAEELDDWNGEAFAPTGESSGVSRKNGALRLTMSHDLVARRAFFALRCISAASLPEKLDLVTPLDLPRMECEEDIAPWSTPLSAENGVFDAASLDWTTDAIFKTASGDWAFTFKGAPMRLFTAGLEFGLNGFVEVFKLAPEKEFYIAFNAAVESRISSWLLHKCKNSTEISLRAGMPPGWRLWRFQCAGHDDSIARYFPVLGTSNKVRIRFWGGIKGRGTNTYFSFAPPDIIIDGGSGDEAVRCNDIPAVKTAIANHYELPDAVRSASFVIVTARESSREAQRSISLLAGIRSGPFQPTAVFNRWRRPIRPGEAADFTLVGAVVTGPVKLPVYSPFPALATGINPRRHTHLIFLGRESGEIREWRAGEDLKLPFVPVWALSAGKYGNVFYCEQQFNVPQLPHYVPSRAEVRHWHNTIWYGRKRIKPPHDPQLARAWRAFVDSAREI